MLTRLAAWGIQGVVADGRPSTEVGDIVGRLDGKVAFITGAARGQGRSHAERLAAEGADIIAVDVCAQLDTVPYPMATSDDLAETARRVEAAGRRVVAVEADVRDVAAMHAAVAEGVNRLDGVHIVLANAGISQVGLTGNHDPDTIFREVVDVNLVGVWNTVHVTAPKHGVVGLMRSFAHWLAPHDIRVNTVHPNGVNTPLINNEALTTFLEPRPYQARALGKNLMAVQAVEPADVSNAIAWLVSDEGRYVTGVTLPVDAGFAIR